MTQEHPITPPPELVAKWAASMCGHYEAARWGADQELESCCALLLEQGAWPWPEEVARIRAARRPKPPTLKERASQVVDWLIKNGRLNDDDAIVLRQLVESLPS